MRSMLLSPPLPLLSAFLSLPDQQTEVVWRGLTYLLLPLLPQLLGLRQVLRATTHVRDRVLTVLQAKAIRQLQPLFLYLEREGVPMFLARAPPTPSALRPPLRVTSWKRAPHRSPMTAMRVSLAACLGSHAPVAAQCLPSFDPSISRPCPATSPHVTVSKRRSPRISRA